MSAKIEMIPIGAIDANPFRRLGVYPFVETKIATLMRSIAEVGMWEGAIGRRKGNRVELAFAHHRVEAAKRLGLDTIPMIVRDLNDEQMIMFMGRENDEDYNSDFLCMLETWEAARKFLGGEPTRLQIAGLLGWTRIRSRGDEMANNVADACADAYHLIQSGHFERKTFAGMAVGTVREIVQTATARHVKIDKAAKEFKWDDSKVRGAKKASSDAGTRAAKEYRAGTIAHKDLKSRADEHFIKKPTVRKEPALLNMAIQPLIKRVRSLLDTDTDGEKINHLIGVLPGVVNDLNEYDEGAIDALSLALAHLSKRASTMSHGVDRKKVVPLPTKQHLSIAGSKKKGA